MPADFPVCEMLKIQFAAPVARCRGACSMARASCCTPVSPGTAATASFADLDFPVSALKTVPGISEPQPRAVAERKRR
jgi:GntR family transcriptional regulator